MADIRINALATTATTPASDDYLALDGTAQGTRKILATNIANNVTDVILGSSGPSVKSTLSARAPRQGLVFDGSSAAVTTTLGSAIGTGNFTIAAWVNPNAAAAKQIIAGQNDGNGSMGLETGGVVAWYDSTAGGKNFNVTAPVGKASLVVITRSSNTLTAYLNGVAGDQHTTAHNLSSTSWRVGSYSGGEQFGGLIASPLIYNRALLASEVVSLYEAGAPAGADYPVPAAGTGITNLARNSTFTDSATDWTGGTLDTVNDEYDVTSPTSISLLSTYFGNFSTKVGMRLRVAFTIANHSGGSVSVSMTGSVSDGIATGLGNGSYTYDFVCTKANNDRLAFSTFSAGSWSLKNVTITVLGLLLAPDAAQAGGGLTWYDTSGNAANITLPASGVSWNVPTSGYWGGNLTISKSSTTTGPVLQLENTNDAIDAGGTLGRLQFYSGDDSGGGNSVRAWIDSIQTTTTPVGSALRFAVANGANAAGEVVRIAESGNLLLKSDGVDSGNGKLQLADHSTSAGGIGFGTRISLHSGGTNKLIITDTTGTNPYLEFREGANPKLQLFTLSSTAYLSTVGATPLILRTNETTALTLDSSQNATFAGIVSATSFRQASAGASLAFGATANANTVFTNPGNGIFVLNKTGGQTGMILQLAAGAGASGRSYSILSTEIGNGIGAGFFAIVDATADIYRFAINSSGQVQALATTDSSTTSTGSLAVSGGIGVAKAVNVGTYYGMVDGVTAPAATSGYAKIYVDTADGDLKVIFGDGTIKTIATDT